MQSGRGIRSSVGTVGLQSKATKMQAGIIEKPASSVTPEGLCYPSRRRSKSPGSKSSSDGEDAVTAAKSTGGVVQPRKSVAWFSYVTDDQIRDSVQKNSTYHDVLIDLGFVPQPQSFNKDLVRFKTSIKKNLQCRLTAMQVSYSHLQNREYNQVFKKRKRMDDPELGSAAAKCGKDIHSRVLRQLVEDDGRPYICEWCHCTHYTWDWRNTTWLWLGRPFSLEVHHIQGRQIERPHDASNLSLLCPQCHATTENFNGRCKAK